MSAKKIYVPRSLDLPNALAFTVSMRAVKQADEFMFDMGDVGHLEPFGMLMVASEIRALLRRFPGAKSTFQRYEHISYAAHMGFFQAAGLNFGKAPGEARGSARYLPLTIFNCQVLRDQAVMKATEVGDVIEERSQKLAEMLCGDGEGDVFETLTYSLREMMRNVVEHSEAEQFGVCAQYWPTKNRVEVAIVDRGIGLSQSLESNPHLDASDDKKSINYALMPAVSGKAYKGARKQRGHWANSGFGLYMTSRICRNGGNFFVGSGSAGMLLTRNTAKRYLPCNFQGTAIRMVIKTDQIADLRGALSRYRDEGYAIQRKYAETVNIDPSSASLMLSSDFDLGLWDRLFGKSRAKS